MENKNRQHNEYQHDAFEEMYYGTFFGTRRIFEDDTEVPAEDE